MAAIETNLPITLAMMGQCPTELKELRDLTRKMSNTTPRHVLSHHTTKWCQPAHAPGTAQYSLKDAGLDTPIQEELV